MFGDQRNCSLVLSRCGHLARERAHNGTHDGTSWSHGHAWQCPCASVPERPARCCGLASSKTVSPPTEARRRARPARIVAALRRGEGKSECAMAYWPPPGHGNGHGDGMGDGVDHDELARTYEQFARGAGSHGRHCPLTPSRPPHAESRSAAQMLNTIPLLPQASSPGRTSPPRPSGSASRRRSSRRRLMCRRTCGAQSFALRPYPPTGILPCSRVRSLRAHVMRIAFVTLHG